ncbi:hypothetical protein [Neolewinella litorea]|uniref:Uncharacterized protein n=1 Tax=Neolewinella litorea TaxID=2562452 RepID=A0A4V3XKR2_9BACT|nr:hypothetical protein [Neolewinella litorea]THH37923.1 hypothetical protein E4021_12870 [Neolewinella litorea]
MISEATIDRTLDRLEGAGEEYEQQIQDFAESQPELMEYLTNEDVEAFTEGERELLLFAALVIFQSVDDERSGLEEVTGDAIATAEERNYEIMAASKGASLRDRLTPFFEQSGEEELLAFVEDLTLSEDEGDAISPEAREPFFVTLKTVIDTLT